MSAFAPITPPALPFVATPQWTADLAPVHVRGLGSYQPGKPVEELERELGITGAIKVASNENPLGPSQLAVDAIKASLDTLHLYPDAGGFALRRALADKWQCQLDELVLGAGSNELLYQLVLATCEPTDEVLSHQYGFLSYKLSAQVAGRRFVAAPATAALGCDVDALIAAMTPQTKLVVVGTPNNPTGSIVTHAQLDAILAALPARALLVVDEAYAEYADAWPEIDHADGMALRRRDPRVIVLRTFSKIYGLAGLRVGYAVCDRRIADLLGRVSRTFNVGSLAQVAAIAALKDEAHVKASAALARQGLLQLQAQPFVRGKVLRSLGNFALIDCGQVAAPLYDQLLRQGVIVRPMAVWGLPHHLRVSVAAPADMPRVVAALLHVIA
jgi:histidinol-phosphate aminotransferase